MISLGIEGTAHTLGIGIVDEENIIANVSHMYAPLSGGIHPREAAEHHSSNLSELLERSIKEAGISFEDIDIVSFSQGPGLGPCLRTVATAARAIAGHLSLPLVGVNHCIAHLEIGRRVTDAVDPVLLYTSGGNTQIITYYNGKYVVIGETEDIGIGNMLDKFARFSGIPFPGGPVIENLARKGRYVNLPYSVKGMNVSFSGILTAATEQLKSGKSLEDIAYSIQEHAFAMLCEITERAMSFTGKKEVLIGGGVARNMRLQDMVRTMVHERNGKFYVPPDELCVDNGAMIAHTGLVMFKNGVRTEIKDSKIKPNYRIDDVVVRWR